MKRLMLLIKVYVENTFWSDNRYCHRVATGWMCLTSPAGYSTAQKCLVHIDSDGHNKLLKVVCLTRLKRKKKVQNIWFDQPWHESSKHYKHRLCFECLFGIKQMFTYLDMLFRSDGNFFVGSDEVWGRANISIRRY